MKKYFVLFLVLCFNLFGYEYQIYNNPNASGIGSAVTRSYFDSNNILYIKVLRTNGSTNQYDTPQYFYNSLYGIKTSSANYISKAEFDDILKNDLSFLNDFLVQETNPILNYYYNDSSFSDVQHIVYDNYELLYNSDGLAVEVIVNDIWAGIYSDVEKGVSGKMYNDSGALVYYNGEAVSWIGSSLDRIFGSIGDYMYQVFQILASPVGVIVSVVFVMSILYFVVRIGRNAIKPFNGKVRKRFLEDH